MKRLITYLLPVIMLLTGCSIDEGNSPAPADGFEQGEITFIVNVPNPSTDPASYALTGIDEERITSFHVFAFDNNDTFVEVSAHNGQITGTGLEKSFKVNFGKLKADGSYRFVVLANVSDLITGMSFNSGQSRNDIMKLFIQTGTNWTADSKDIPMWGECGAVSITGIPKITLLRMLAKIDVKVGGGIPFKLTKVLLCNYLKDGRVVPAQGNVSGNKVTRPTVTGNRSTGVNNAAVYSAPVPDAGDWCVNKIYAFEADTVIESNKIDLAKTHTLIIGGLYGAGNTTDTTYYRVNFYDKDKNKHLNLLRNHSYEITITGVDGRGYETAQEAFDSKGMNIETTIIPWNDSEMTEITFDGQFLMSVSKARWTFSKSKRTVDSNDNILHVYTDYPQGWGYVEIDLGDDSAEEGWLSLDVDTGFPKTKTAVHLLLKENTGSTSRTGKVTFSAGRLSYTVEVTQTAEEDVPVTDLLLDKTTLTLTVGETGKLTATIVPSNATNKEVVWESDDKTVVSVDQEGNIKALSVGEDIEITATTADGGHEVKCKVTVNPVIPAELKITLPVSAVLSLTTGTLTLTPEFDPAGTYTVMWDSDDDEVATVANGVVTAIAVGTAQITAKVGDKISNICYLTVSNSTPGTLAGWAGSNIYWNGSKMMFDDEFVTDRQGYQGLYFKWGALYGGTDVAGNTVYKPNGTTETITWDKIEYVKDGNGTDKTSKHLYSKTPAVSDDAKIGDICKYLTDQNGGNIYGKQWRMPTMEELEEWYSEVTYPGEWKNLSGNAMSTTEIPSGLEKGGNLLPAAGRRNTDGTIYSQGTYGFYWSSSPYNTYGYNLYFYKLNIEPVSDLRSNGFSVRCVVVE